MLPAVAFQVAAVTKLTRNVFLVAVVPLLADALDALAITIRTFQERDFSDNEIAKSHVRHMVGGRTPHVAAERESSHVEAGAASS